MTNLKKLLEQATARPWEERGSDIQGYAIWCEKGGSEKYDAQSFPLKINKANARLITLAANHFEAVVKALQHFAIVGGDNLSDDIDYKMTATDIRNARAVLAAIEKDTSHV